MPNETARHPLLEQAIAAVQAGDLELGRSLLARVLQADPRNVDAWLWLSTAVDELPRRAECLRRVIALDPQHRVAWERLAAITSVYPDGVQPSLAGRDALEFKCAHCGGERRFDVAVQGLRCDHCGQAEPVSSPSAADEERAVFGMLDHPAAQSAGAATLAVRCGACGATVGGSGRQGSFECPFCGTEIVLSEQHGFMEVILPQALVPFQVDEKAARAAVGRWLGRGWLHPPDLASKSTIRRLRGVYIPFWTFDDLMAARTVDEDHFVFCDDYLICGSYSLPERTARRLEPFDTKKIVAYRPEYVAGWAAEISQLSMSDASLRARERMIVATRRDFSLRTQVTEVSVALMTYKHVLLPVWVGAYMYDGRTFPFAVNGQTGKVTGDAPHTPAILFDALTLPVAGIPLWAAVTLLRWPHLIGPRAVALTSAVWLLLLTAYALSYLLGWRNKIIW